jgi:hypothetical protein
MMIRPMPPPQYMSLLLKIRTNGLPCGTAIVSVNLEAKGVLDDPSDGGLGQEGLLEVAPVDRAGRRSRPRRGAGSWLATCACEGALGIA